MARKSVKERILAGVRVELGPCWEWQGTLRNGYGAMSVGGQMAYVHRLSHETFIGPIPPRQVIAHRCDNRRCVNPEHLFAAPHRVNMLDMVLKGRQARGERHGRAKLTRRDVEHIKQLKRDGELTSADVGTIFDIHADHIRAIWAGRYWSHVR